MRKNEKRSDRAADDVAGVGFGQDPTPNPTENPTFSNRLVLSVDGSTVLAIECNRRARPSRVVLFKERRSESALSSRTSFFSGKVWGLWGLWGSF